MSRSHACKESKDTLMMRGDSPGMSLAFRNASLCGNFQRQAVGRHGLYSYYNPRATPLQSILRGKV